MRTRMFLYVCVSSLLTMSLGLEAHKGAGAALRELEILRDPLTPPVYAYIELQMHRRVMLVFATYLHS